jgi:DNA-binding transcriptional MerR regulator
MDQLSLFDQLKIGEHKDLKEKVDEKSLTKIYYTISEVAKMFDVNASLLRFWEKEFPKEIGVIKKNQKGDRYYSKDNIKQLNLLFYLLKERRLTIEGAKQTIKENKKSAHNSLNVVENLQIIRSFLVDLKTALKEKDNTTSAT